jgi:dolichol-phosphate mannosyltransferase
VKIYDFFEMDADFSHNPMISKSIQCMPLWNCRFSIGSRYVTGVNVVNWPLNRVLLSYFASVCSYITGMKIHDATAGFVCYKRTVLENIGINKINLWLCFSNWNEIQNLCHNSLICRSANHFTDRTQRRI